jgi:hypothetical protein
MFIIYKTDNWHSYASRDVIGVCTSLKQSIEVINEQCDREGEPHLQGDELYNIQTLLQTQNYSGEGEFQIEKITINKLM